MASGDEDRSGIERRLTKTADWLVAEDNFLPNCETIRSIREAVDAIGEARRALLEARKKIARLTPMGSPAMGIELSDIQETIADDCDRVRGVIDAALAKLGPPVTAESGVHPP
jgi:hypothetical protein